MINEQACIFPLCSEKVERDEFCLGHEKYFPGPKHENIKNFKLHEHRTILKNNHGNRISFCGNQ